MGEEVEEITAELLEVIVAVVAVVVVSAPDKLEEKLIDPIDEWTSSIISELLLCSEDTEIDFLIPVANSEGGKFSTDAVFERLRPAMVAMLVAVADRGIVADAMLDENDKSKSSERPTSENIEVTISEAADVCGGAFLLLLLVLAGLVVVELLVFGLELPSIMIFYI